MNEPNAVSLTTAWRCIECETINSPEEVNLRRKAVVTRRLTESIELSS